MACWRVVLPLLVSLVTGSPLEAISPGMNIIYLDSYGVNITQCTQLRFRLKACKHGHILLGDGTSFGSYEIIIGGWENTKSGLRHCSQGFTELLFNTEGILDCNEYRNFWVSWGNDRIAFGTGNTPHVGTIFKTVEPLVHEITVLGFMGFTNTSAAIKLGEDTSSLFELVAKDANYRMIELQAGLLANDVSACGRRCHEHTQCGRFSYWHLQKWCQLFDRYPTIQSDLRPEDNFDSWSMTYCKA